MQFARFFKIFSYIFKYNQHISCFCTLQSKLSYLQIIMLIDLFPFYISKLRKYNILLCKSYYSKILYYNVLEIYLSVLSILLFKYDFNFFVFMSSMQIHFQKISKQIYIFYAYRTFTLYYMLKNRNIKLIENWFLKHFENLGAFEFKLGF